jgi:hypothetical protein
MRITGREEGLVAAIEMRQLRKSGDKSFFLPVIL